MPALTFPLHLTIGEQARHHPVQVVWLDTHLLRDLRDGDARRAAHELQRLVGTRTATTAATSPAGAATRTATGGCRRRGARSARAARSTPGADERRTCGLELGDLLLQLAETVIDFLHGAIDKTSQIDFPPGGA